MTRWLPALVLLVPLLWLGNGIRQQEQALAAAREFRIPIGGYDPRDLLRGRYIRFTYQWALSGDADLCATDACLLCLDDAGGQVTARVVPRGTACRWAVDPKLSALDVRPRFGDDGRAAVGGRLFVSETSAPELERQLAEGPMQVIASVAPDGRLINQRIEPAP